MPEKPALSDYDLKEVAFLIYSKTSSFQAAVRAIQNLSPETKISIDKVKQWSIAGRWDEKLKKVDSEMIKEAMPLLQAWRAQRFRDLSELFEDLSLRTSDTEDKYVASIVQSVLDVHTAQETMIQRAQTEEEDTGSLREMSIDDLERLLNDVDTEETNEEFESLPGEQIVETLEEAKNGQHPAVLHGELEGLDEEIRAAKYYMNIMLEADLVPSHILGIERIEYTESGQEESVKYIVPKNTRTSVPGVAADDQEFDIIKGQPYKKNRRS